MLFSVGALGQLSGYDGGVQAVSERAVLGSRTVVACMRMDKPDVVTSSPDRRRGIVIPGTVQQSQYLKKDNLAGVIDGHSESKSIRCV